VGQPCIPRHGVAASGDRRFISNAICLEFSLITTPGYSVFVAIQKEPGGPLALPITEADRLAAQSTPPTIVRAPANVTAREPPEVGSSSLPDGLEDEDYELQAAIAASMGGGFHLPPGQSGVSDAGQSSHSNQAASSSRYPQPASSLPSILPFNFPGLGPIGAGSFEDDANFDPVEASRRRNAQLLEQFQRAQDQASRELDLDSFQRRRDQEQLDEEEEMRRAIAESEALAREYDDVSIVPNGAEAAAVDATLAPLRARGDAPRIPGGRVYDDEDEELQAALRASLESVPPGFVLPESPQAKRPSLPFNAAQPSVPASDPPAQTPADAPKVGVKDEDEAMTEAETEPEAKEPEVDREEMRRRRLARFGG